MEEISHGNGRDRIAGDAGLHLKLFSVSTVADLLGLSRKGVYALLRQGVIGYVRIGRRAIRISEHQLVEFVQQRRVSPNHDVDGRRRLIRFPAGSRR